MNTQPPYPRVERADYPSIERRILDRWRDSKTFQRSIDQRAGGSNEYLFFDGPPFANGLPHYGHLLTGYVKDLIPRYQTMRGRRVERRFGWDCHGLPVEMESEKELGVSGRRAITEYGIAPFNDHCATSVMRYTKEWETYVTRQARWVDFTNDYKTMDLPYMESVMWAFKQLWDKGLVYEAYRVMPYSWGAETPLSNFEIRLDDATRPRQDPALTVAFRLKHTDVPTSIWAWTTTPWTLPSNLALAVGPDVDYAIYNREGEHVILGADVVGKYDKELAGAVLVDTVKGSTLAGKEYEPLFAYFAGRRHAHQILVGAFVETSEGTGIVHMAPGFGEVDKEACDAAGIETVVPVDDEGKFTAEVSDYAGQNVFDANPQIIRDLRTAGHLIRHDSYMHNYPHCWRTDTPIIYRALSSWYVEVTAFRDRMVELNQQINWIPEHTRDGAFGKWLEGARDWSISRNRFWGAPIPVWKSDNPEYPRTDVYGSIAELEADFGVKVTNLHRPFIDDLVRPNPDDPTGQSMMRRVPEVLDCWFESGSMPYAQAHYPFENKDWVDNHSADFIVEYIAQTRGWFYTMHVLSVALFDRPAFKNCICHGVVLDEDGRKLSKRLRNYPDPEDVFENIGADALRWFLMSSPILRGLDFRIDREGKGIAEIVRLVLNPIWNAYTFFTLYANVDGYRAHLRYDSPQLLDRYILAKTRELVDGVTESLDGYDIAAACVQIQAFLDALNNWYIRRSRDRFWAPASGNSADKSDAYDTLYTVLHTLMRVGAPLLPMVTEEVYTGLTGEESVHLTDWPDSSALPLDPALVEAMDKVRDVCSAALSLREARSLRTRLPLARLTVAGRDTALVAPFAELIADEVNVKAVEFSDDLAAFGSFVLRPNGKVLGPRLGGAVQTVIKAAKAGEWATNADGSVTVAGHTLAGDDFELALQAKEGDATAALRGNATIVNLDVEVTDALRDEGTARDLIRRIQDARRKEDLIVTDRIDITIDAPPSARTALEAHQAMIAGEVLAASITWGTPAGSVHEAKLDAELVRFSLRVA